MEHQRILIGHGDGGKLSHELIEDLILPILGDRNIGRGEDSEIVNIPGGSFAYTTDSFVVDPVFFSGGNIGKLSVCGTINDLVSRGARPLYITFSLIIEEGFEIDKLEQIVESVRVAAEESDVYVVAGDLKVLPSRKIDKICINTSGVGAIDKSIDISVYNAKVNDDIIISGTVGDHALSVLSLREGLGFERVVSSDCAPLNGMVKDLLAVGTDIHCLKDPTRGGLITALNEITINSNVGIIVRKDSIPVSTNVKAGCEMLGLDPLYLANEGKIIIIAPSYLTSDLINMLKSHRYGKHAAKIGEIVHEHPGMVLLEDSDGVKTIVDMLFGAQLPRLC